MKNETYFIEIEGRRIGPQYEPYIIAELSANHNGDIRRAYDILEQAKSSGAHAVKLQSYTPDTLTINCDKQDFTITSGLWQNRTLYELYGEAHMPWEWHKPLFEKAKQLDITIFSTPFDNTSVDLLEDLNAPAYKIASFEIIDLELIRYVAETGKPLIISTGMANKIEIQEALDTAYSAGCKELALLHCVSGYPAPSEDYNLKTIPDMADRFNVVVGLSDHTIDNTTAITSIALGASLIEKHVTLDRTGGGPDDSFSLEMAELHQLCRDTRRSWNALGRISYERAESEKNNTIFRRSLYVVKPIKAGSVIRDGDIRSIRPGYGAAPKHLKRLLGRIAKVDMEFGTPVNLDDFT